jgi:hypothetical protein
MPMYFSLSFAFDFFSACRLKSKRAMLESEPVTGNNESKPEIAPPLNESRRKTLQMARELCTFTKIHYIA